MLVPPSVSLAESPVPSAPATRAKQCSPLYHPLKYLARLGIDANREVATAVVGRQWEHDGIHFASSQGHHYLPTLERGPYLGHPFLRLVYGVTLGYHLSPSPSLGPSVDGDTLWDTTRRSVPVVRHNSSRCVREVP